MRTYMAIIWGSRIEKWLALLLRRPINAFVKKALCRGCELQIIDSRQLYLLSAIIDRSLYPEYYTSMWVDEKGDSAP